MSEKMNSTDLCPPFPIREAPRVRRAAAEVTPGRGTPGPQQEIRTLLGANGKPRARCQDPCDSARLPPPQGSPLPPPLMHLVMCPCSTGQVTPRRQGLPLLPFSTVCGRVGGWMDRWMDGRRTLGKEGGKEGPSYQRPTSAAADLKTSTALKPRLCGFVAKSHLWRPRGL